MNYSLQLKLIEFLSGFATRNRLNRFEQVLSQRTRYITVALENIFQPHNASAVLRTMECLGIQDVHIIENDYEYKVNPEIALGASQWLTLRRYSQTADNRVDAIDTLRSNGYRIVATTPRPEAVAMDSFDLERGPAAFFFGTELEGLSDKILEQADEFVRIPICGFTESFNVSVSAALTMYPLAEKLRKDDAINWRLSDKELESLRLAWLKQSVRHSDLLIKRFLASPELVQPDTA